MPVTAYIGLGSNLAQPIEQLHAGMAALAQLPGTRVLRCSSLYRSAPVGVIAQPDFVNAVCAIETVLSALDLLRRLLDIERMHGRVRGAEWGAPRTLDLDLLLYAEEATKSVELTLPHPRMHERAFVLAPLAEIAPTLEIPRYGTASALLRACAGQRVERMENC